MPDPKNRIAPTPIRRGSVLVKIYKVERRRGVQQGEHFFQVADYSSGKRKLVSFADLREAKAHAERVAAQLSRGDAYAAGFGAQDRAVFDRISEITKPTGVPLEVIVSDYVELLKVVGGDRQRLLEAARFFVRRNPATLPQKPVSEAVAELIASKKAMRASARYLTDLESRLGRFEKAFRVSVGTVTGPQIQRWLESLDLSPQSLKNYRTVLHLFFKFCATRGYLPQGMNPAAETESIRVKPIDVEIFTPEEFKRLLDATDTQFQVCIALQGLAGLRSNEVERIEWEDIDMGGKLIVVSRGVAKTASRRTIPICDALMSWLHLTSDRKGKVWKGSHDDYYKSQQETARAAKVTWKHNALRHSYASYRFALVSDAGKVAAELGHSAAILHKHYRELAKPGAAQLWFGTTPG